jgi:hypothetical protein
LPLTKQGLSLKTSLHYDKLTMGSPITTTNLSRSTQMLACWNCYAYATRLTLASRHRSPNPINTNTKLNLKMRFAFLIIVGHVVAQWFFAAKKVLEFRLARNRI